jgi:hypothetical protein
MKRRRLLIQLAALLALGACAKPLPVQVEGQGGSETKPRLKVKMKY